MDVDDDDEEGEEGEDDDDLDDDDEEEVGLSYLEKDDISVSFIGLYMKCWLHIGDASIGDLNF